MSRPSGESSRSHDQPRASALSGLLVPLSFFACAAALANHHVDHENAVETAFLGVLATVILSALAFVDRAPHWVLAGTALLSALTLWILPAGGVRGATLGVVLVLGLGLAIGQESRRGSKAFSLRACLALALACQTLFRPEPWLGLSWSWTFAASAVLLPVAAGLGLAELARNRRRAPLLAVALVVALQRGISPELALALAAWCLVSAAIERRPTAIAWATLTIAILLSSSSELAVLLDTNRGWRDVAAGLAWIALLTPAALQPRPGRLGVLVAALGLAFATLWLVPTEVALLLALPVLFEALALSTLAGKLQVAWSAALVAGSALAAGYPWLRPRPVEAALAMIGLDAGWPSALFVVAIFWTLVAALRFSFSRREISAKLRPARWSAYCAIAALLAGVALNVAPPFGALLAEPVVLSQTRPGLGFPLAETVRSAFVDSYVSNGVSVPPGTPILELVFEGANGTIGRHVLRSGSETGEWAARRPGLLVEAPQPWISWPAPDGPYFAQRYRSLASFETPLEASALRLQRLDGLPPDLELAVFQIGVRP